MKRFIILFSCVFLCKVAVGQKDSLSFDDHGKYVYYKVVSAGSDNSIVLYPRALAFFKTAYDKKTLKLATQDDKNKGITANGYFFVSKKLSLAKHDDGQISCKVNIEVKDYKYRYWFTDFVLTPYERDRYNNFVPVPGQIIDMEKASKKLNTVDVDHYLDECARFAQQVAAKLQQYMIALPSVKHDTTKKVIHINKGF